MIWKISNDRVQSPIVKSSIMWNRIKSSLLVLFLLFALFFGTMMIQQNAILRLDKSQHYTIMNLYHFYCAILCNLQARFLLENVVVCHVIYISKKKISQN